MQHPYNSGFDFEPEHNSHTALHRSSALLAEELTLTLFEAAGSIEVKVPGFSFV